MYFVLGALPGIVEEIADRSKALDSRQYWVIGLMAALGGISNLKAYVSQTFSGWATGKGLPHDGESSTVQEASTTEEETK